MVDQVHTDRTFRYWCGGNYELIHARLYKLFVLSNKRLSGQSSANFSNKLILPRNVKNSSHKQYPTWEETEFNDLNLVDYYLLSLEGGETKSSSHQKENASADVDFRKFKEELVSDLKSFNFHKPRTVPKRNHLITRDELLEYITKRFKDMEHSVDKIDEYSTICNVNQFLCCHLLKEGLDFYSTNKSQPETEFKIIENMLFRQTMFQLKTILLLISFVKIFEFMTTDFHQRCKVFPEAEEVLKHLSEKQLVRNLFIALLSSMNECYSRHKAQAEHSQRTQQNQSAENMDNRYSADFDPNLLFRHSTHYLNTLLDVITTYFITFNPKEEEIKCLMVFLPHVYDVNKMYNLPEMSFYLKFLFEDYSWDSLSGFYPISRSDLFFCLTTKEFDSSCKTNLTLKLSILLMVMLNPNIYRYDGDFKLFRIDGSILKLFKDHSESLFYRGLIDEASSSTMNMDDLILRMDGEDLTLRMNVDDEPGQSSLANAEKLKELKTTREKYADVELMLDFVIYGAYMDDANKKLECFSNNVLEKFLSYCNSFTDNTANFDTAYYQVYINMLKIVFTPLFFEKNLMSETWYNLLQYEASCKVKLESLMRMPVTDKINTAVFRVPGITLIQVLNLFIKVYDTESPELMFRMLQSIAESYNSIMPERSSVLYAVHLKRYNERYYRHHPEPAGEGVVEEESGVPGTKARPSASMEEAEGDSINLNSSNPDHMLAFPNAGFSWHERNRALLDLVNLCCEKNMTFVEAYPRLVVELLRFTLHLTKFTAIDDKIPPFLNSVACRDLHFPSLFNRVVSQLKSLVRGDLDRLPNLVYDELVARDGLIESERAVRESVRMHMEKEEAAQNPLGVEDPSLYIRERFKTSQPVPGRLYGFSRLYEKDSDPSAIKEDYLKDVSSYRINANSEEELPKSKLKPFQMVRTKPYTFPHVSGPSDVRRALSNLGLGTALPFNLVEVASLLFKLIRRLDPLLPISVYGMREKKVSKGTGASGSEESPQIRSRLAVETGNYSYLDVVFTILSSNFYPGTDLVIGDMLLSIASVHVGDHKLCKMALSKFRILLNSENSALGRRLTRWEFVNLMDCMNSILSYIPQEERYTLYSDTDDLLELTKYVLSALEHVMLEPDPVKQTPNTQNPVTGLAAMVPKINYATEYYMVLDRAFGFLLIVSRGPMGLLNISKATQYVYEQILLHGSPVAYKLVRSSNVINSLNALRLVCNVFKRDFLLSTLHNLPCYDLKTRPVCDRCHAAKQDVDEKETGPTRTPGSFSWFLSKIPIFSSNRSGGYIRRKMVLDQSGRTDQKRLESGCEVCHNVDFNQKPLLISTAHDAFKDALLTYSNEVSCDVIGNVYAKDTEVKTITLFLMAQFAERNSSLRLSRRTLEQIKQYLYSVTVDRDGDSTDSTDISTAKGLLGNKGPNDSIRDAYMEWNDLMLQNKLKFLSYARQDKASSLSNLRDMPTCTFKTMVAYLSSADEEMTLKIVDDNLFMSIVNYVRDTWRRESWTDVYMMETLTKLIRDERYAKLLMLVWPTLFNDMDGYKVDFKAHNALKFSKLTYMFEIVARYSSVFPYFYEREKEAHTNREMKDVSMQNKLSLGGHPEYDEYKNLLNLSMEVLAEETGASFMDYPELTSDVIHSFCSNERELYTSLLKAANRLGFDLMNKLWNFNSYSLNKHDMLTKLILPNPEAQNREERTLSTNLGNEHSREGEAGGYSFSVHMYNGTLVSFAAMFRRMIKIYESYNPYKLHRIFDIDPGNVADELKLILQLTIIKRLYTHRSFDELVNILVKLGRTLLHLDRNNDALRTKLYHVINHLIEVASAKELEDSVEPLGGSRGDPLINKILVSRLSETTAQNTILDALFTDSVESYSTYADVDVLGHIVIENCIHGKDDECDGEFVSASEARRARRLQDVPYHRRRVLESLYFALEGKQPSLRMEALKLLSSVLKGLSTYEATKIEHDTGTLLYSSLGALSLQKAKRFVSKLLMRDYSACKSCIEAESVCDRCSETLVAALNVLQALTKIHQFRSFWFELKATESETLADMILRCTYLNAFNPRAPIHVLQPTMKVIEYFVNTNSSRIRSAVITWLNSHADALLSHVCAEEFDSLTTSYICSLLRIYKTSFVSLLNFYRGMNTFENNFAMILADLNCKFPLASTLQALVPNLVKFFSDNLESDGSWLAILLCLQSLFPVLGAFETEVDFASQAPVKTKALELINLVVDATLRCSDGLLEYIRSYSSFNISSSLPEDPGDADYELKCLKHDRTISMFDEILELRVSTTDCCLLLLRYILSLVQLPNGVATNGAQQAIPGHSLLFRIRESTRLSAVIETLAKVCTANGATLTPRGLHTKNFSERLFPGLPEPSVSSLRRSDYTRQSLFSDLLSSLLNLDSALKSYT
ncbi:conserved hypothetical protein [Theileria orientalis strain Shintoku]|uniref:Uncharacterized protein n=1 Tax=Theileria orientalis strain Shintoku TaxID=869250 RepID=J4CDB4_THEOR|nr:conserved hypothetical protein [Theileria orientalis strain Shintoku]BAM40847.1 conserved hypothetical protein [Theileria orientalis strain Shintoku]|eukprot:XP_009691148.1 conserved hypothetical protein [Theileria orientalis strain Shintoku]